MNKNNFIKNKLTNKQQIVFDKLCEYYAEYGYSPTIRELCKMCDLSSTATMWVHLQNLRKKGYIYFNDNKFRTIQTNLKTDYRQKCNDLQQRIDKTKELLKNIEYFKETIKDEFGCEYTNEYCFKEYIEEAIEILGDKE